MDRGDQNGLHADTKTRVAKMKPQEASRIERIPLAAGMKAGILLVDDRPANLLALEAVLDPLGQRLVRATSGEEALEKLAAEEFAVIVMDVRMPGMDGLRTAEVISQRENAARIPIIFVTAVPIGNADVVSGYACGAVDFLLKPFDPEILRSKVSVLVELYQKEQMIKRQAALLRQRDREAFERRSELRFRSLMDALPQCVWVARADQTFYYWNKRAGDYIGLPVASVGAERLFENIHPDDLEMVKAEWQRATSFQRSAEVQVRIRRHSDGAYRWFLMRGVPQQDESGKLTGWIVAATDIDSEHHALQEAEAASRLKEEFLATVSHELRNPLNAIVGWIHMLRSGSLDSVKSAKALETIERNVHLQASLIDDILDVSRVIRGKISVSFRTVRMGAWRISPSRRAGWPRWSRSSANSLTLHARALPERPRRLIRDLAWELPALVVFRVLGVPDSDVPRVKAGAASRLLVMFGHPSEEQQIELARGMAGFWQYARELVEARAAQPRDDFTSDLILARDHDLPALSRHEVTTVVFGLLLAGHETTTNLIGNAMRRMLTDRDAWREICRSPQPAPNAVEEVLRFDSSVIAWRRRTNQAVEIGGVAMPAGANLLLLIGSANRDPQVFADPERFDIHRTNADEHLAFGLCAHFCLGAPLARLEARVVLEEISACYPSMGLTPAQTLRFMPNISFRGPLSLLAEWDQ
jgi:PAS domain S-box-containing protein